MFINRKTNNHSPHRGRRYQMKKYDGFDALKTELIRRGYESANADQQAAAYLRCCPDDVRLTEREVLASADQIEQWIE